MLVLYVLCVDICMSCISRSAFTAVIYARAGLPQNGWAKGMAVAEQQVSEEKGSIYICP